MHNLFPPVQIFAGGLWKGKHNEFLNGASDGGKWLRPAADSAAEAAIDEENMVAREWELELAWGGGAADLVAEAAGDEDGSVGRERRGDKNENIYMGRFQGSWKVVHVMQLVSITFDDIIKLGIYLVQTTIL